MKGGNTTLFDNPNHSGDLRSLSNEKKRNIGNNSTLAVSNLNEKIKELFDDYDKNSLININYFTNNGYSGKESNANLDENIRESLSNVSPNNSDDNSNKKSENRSIQNNQSSKCEVNCGNNVTDFNKKKFKKGKWTKEEDQKLLSLIEKYSFNWKIIKSKFRHRTLTQIKQRYMNNLNPNINRSKFTNEEDRRLDLYYSIYGTNWKKISSFFEFRPPNFIKNRFYTKNRTFLRKNRDNTSNKNEGSNLDNIVEQRSKSKIFDTFKLEKVRTEKPFSKNNTDNTIEESNFDNISEILGNKKAYNDPSEIYESIKRDKSNKICRTVKSDKDFKYDNFHQNKKSDEFILGLNKNKIREKFSALESLKEKKPIYDNKCGYSVFKGEKSCEKQHEEKNSSQKGFDHKNNKISFNFGLKNKKKKNNINSISMASKSNSTNEVYAVNSTKADLLLRTGLIKLSKNSINLHNFNKNSNIINDYTQNNIHGLLNKKRKRRIKCLRALVNKSKTHIDKMKKCNFMNYIKNFTIYNNNLFAKAAETKEEIELDKHKNQINQQNNSNILTGLNSTQKNFLRRKYNLNNKNDSKLDLMNNPNFSDVYDSKKENLGSGAEELLNGILYFGLIYKENLENLRKVEAFYKNNYFDNGDLFIGSLIESGSLNFKNNKIFSNYKYVNYDIIQNNQFFIRRLLDNKKNYESILKELEEKRTEFRNDLMSCGIINND